ncbi:hypothetical protein BGZ57DRAFT_1000561 [Hyaloscypha finlandica]|nr:hypothetical protein BGZ57DRAFT_1000561 [Hyaloscypha finlandica]
MFISKLVIAAIFFVAVRGKARFTNSQFNTVEVGKSFNITWTGNKNDVSLELRHGHADNVILVEVIAKDIKGNWFNWNPNENVPVENNTLKVIDLDDQEPNYSPLFSIKGANTSWVSSEDPLLNGSDNPGTNPGDTSPPGSGGLPTAVKVALAVVIPVIVFVVGTCIGLLLRNRRDKARRGDHSPRTMSTDTTPTRYKSKYQNYSTPIRQELHSHSATVVTPIKKLLFRTQEVNPTLNQASPTWSEDAVTPPNNQPTASPSGGEDELYASGERRHVSNYNRPRNDPESPTPTRRVVSAPVREQDVGVARQSPPPYPDQHLELSAGTLRQSRAELEQPQPPHELPQNQRNVSSPLPTSSSSSRQIERNDRDPFARVGFGNSDDPGEIVAHMAAGRQEAERMKELQQLESEREDIERRIGEARQKRG